jgi:hypothetical protein
MVRVAGTSGRSLSFLTASYTTAIEICMDDIDWPKRKGSFNKTHSFVFQLDLHCTLRGTQKHLI